MAKAIRMTAEQLLDIQSRIAGRHTAVQVRESEYASRREKRDGEKRRKYGNQPVEIDGIRFDSKAEARYYAHLKAMERSGEIKNLRRQVEFELAPSAVIYGRKRPPLRYVADFTYERDGQIVVADVKGVSPDAYRIKRHLMKTVHGIDIEEIRS